ncbi:hemolysin activation protein [Yersinia entomophaga]|uniref:Hemolysin activation protein n=2 Tax=Yersiniaceae TaxID=1903411 RepID=A0ABM6BI27_YERET|nr:hemolysin activation protein [Yersinia entomophaga]
MESMIKRIGLYFLLVSSPVQAATQPAMGNFLPLGESEARRSLQNSAREVNELMEQRRYQQLRQPKAIEEDVIPAQAALPESDRCLAIKGVYLQGITLLGMGELNKLTALPSDCITSNDINRLTHELTRLYVRQGYITARVNFVPLNADGELGINVIEGVVEKIEGGDYWVNSRLLFPDVVGKPLKLSQLDQGLDQANRLQSNQTKLDILPGRSTGGSIIRLNNTHKKPWLLTGTLDNYGQKNTGEWLVRTTASVDSPFGLSDFVSMNISSTIKDESRHHNRAYTLLYSLPYGAWTFSSFASYSEYLNYQRLPLNTVKLDGNTQQYGGRADYMFYRDQEQIDALNVQLTYKNVNNYLESSRLGISSTTLTVLELGANHLQILPRGVLSLNASVERGLSWFGADKASSHRSANYPDAQFTKAKMFATLSQRFSLWEQPYQLTHLFYGQYSRDPLPGVEWLSLTDRSAVRGFSRNTLSADNGWYLQNTLSRPMTLGNASLTPRIGVDVGRVQAHRDAVGWQSNMGLSAGVSFKYSQAVVDLDVSRGWLLSDQKSPTDPIQVLARLSYSF